MQRRDFLTIITAHAAAVSAPMLFSTPALAQARESTPANETAAKPFDFDSVVELARQRASEDFVKPESELVGTFADISYDQYRAVRFRRDLDPWKDVGNFAIDLLAPGLIYYEPVRINTVSDGVATPVPFSPRLLDFDPALFPDGVDMETVGNMGWSGFRLRTPLNRPDVMDEFIVFQGASYFRAVARGTLYGLSARGLAIGTGSAEGEEFPLFTDFWLHKPEEGESSVRIHAILDSRSVAGAYQFDITPGAETVILTRMALFPRTDLEKAGIAPLTSMYWFGPASRTRVDDYRPAVHDSDGLQMVTGTGQRLWRVLSAPDTLQISGFVDNNPHGFGLAQRERSFENYQDAEARYERRPSAWIEPLEDWGKGQVTLVEIPDENEFNDNIVSYWSPDETLKAGEQYDYNFRMTFSGRPPDDAPLARVIQTRAGEPVNDPEGVTVIVDFDLTMFSHELPESSLRASTGKVTNPYLVALPEQGALRLAFLFTPDGDNLSELSAQLQDANGVALSERWLARWSR